jgi:hypothetical protein
MFTTASLSPKVYTFLASLPNLSLRIVYRRDSNWKYMVGRLFYVLKVDSALFRAVMRDPAVYPEPDDFKPERFLSPDGILLDDPILTTVFGSGKRICPGRHFADATLFIVVASLLSVFNIEKVPDPEGRPFVYSYVNSIVRCSTSISPYKGTNDPGSRPNSFPCSIIPRDKRAEELIIADEMAR